jgi:hypothetical protein
MSLRFDGFTISQITQEIRRDLMNGLRKTILVAEGLLAGTKCLWILTLRVLPTRGANLAGRQGVFAAAFRNPSKDRHFLHNSHDVSELAFFTFFRRLPFVSFCFRVLPVQ